MLSKDWGRRTLTRREGKKEEKKKGKYKEEK